MAKGNYGNILKYIEKTLDLAISKAKDIRFDRHNPQHLYAICVYGRLLEMIIEFHALVSNKRFASAPIILRTIHEIFVDFRNNIKNKEYYNYMIACHEQNRRILLNYVLRYKDNPLFKAFYSDIEKVKAEKKSLKKRLEELANDGFEPLSVSQRFVLANMKDEYNSMYQQFTYNVHNALGVVEEQCIEHTEGDYIVTWFPDYDVEDYWTYLDIIAGFLTEATMNLHDFFENKDSEIIGLGEKIENLRSNYNDSSQ
ncbi:MAG: DUF5677 domain-containing protein [Desulfobulbaceae bacterium]